jgi:hypothetical protein
MSAGKSVVAGILGLRPLSRYWDHVRAGAAGSLRGFISLPVGRALVVSLYPVPLVLTPPFAALRLREFYYVILVSLSISICDDI